jgi:flagellar biogenesis protein FliO
MDIVRQSLALVLVFALLWTARLALRKKGRIGIRRARSAPDLIESRGQLALTARHSVHWIRIGDRELILALHPEGVTFLGNALPEAAAERKEMTAR